MIFEKPLVKGKLIRRYKRFLAEVELESGEAVTAHCPNSGSMKGVNAPGNEVCLSYHPDPARKLKYTWEMIRIDGGWVGINTQVPNRLAAEAFEAKKIPAFRSYAGFRREVTVAPGTRLDFVLGSRSPCWVEVKNVTLVERGTALFPDAVTERGTKHLRHLIGNVRSGGKSAMLYIVQHHQAEVFSPADDIDPLYARTLREAATEGVQIEVWKANVSPRAITLDSRLKVRL